WHALLQGEFRTLTHDRELLQQLLKDAQKASASSNGTSPKKPKPKAPIQQEPVPPAELGTQIFNLIKQRPGITTTQIVKALCQSVTTQTKDPARSIRQGVHRLKNGRKIVERSGGYHIIPAASASG